MAKDENCLLFDTSNRWLSVAVANASKIISRNLELPRRSFQYLPSLIRELCQEADIERPQWIVTTVGPGSYTGIRLGVGFARNLGQLWQIPVMGISSLPFYAYVCLRKQEVNAQGLAIMLDGKQGRAYSMSIKLSEDCPLEEAVTGIMPGEYTILDQAVDVFLASIPESYVIFVDDLRALKHYIAPENLNWCLGRMKNATELASPQAEYLYELATLYGGIAQAKNWAELKPSYLRVDPARARYPQGFSGTSSS